MSQSYEKREPFEGKAFPLHVFTAGSTEELIQPHWHEHLEFIQIAKGSPLVSIGDKTYHTAKGDIFFVNSGVTHRAWVLPGEAASTCALVFDRFFVTNVTEGFDTRYLYSLFSSSTAVEVRFCPSHPLWPVLNECFNEILSEMTSRNIGYEMLVKSHVYKMVALLLRHSSHGLGPRKSRTCLAQELDVLKPVFAYIDTHYASGISTRAMSALANMSEYHFCRYFKRVTGQTLTEYVNQVRINRVVQLLLDSSLPVREICETAGFRNISNFNRLFKESKGTSPVKFRASYRCHQSDGL